MKLWSLIILSLLATNAKAEGIMRMQSESLMSLRNDSQQKIESPFYENFGVNYETFNRSFIFDTNFSVFANPQKSNQNDFQLYLLNASYELIPSKLIVQAGRTADFTKSAGSLLSDQVSARYLFWDTKASIGAYYGVERDLNSDVEHQVNTKQVGGKFDFKSGGKAPYFVNAKLQKEIKPSYSEDYATVGISGPLSRKLWDSEFLLSGEHNITNTSTRRVEAGVDFYPNMYLANRWRALSYKSRPLVGEEHDPIFAVISRGRLYELTTLFDYLYTSNLTLSLALSYNDYLWQQNTRTDGYRSEFNVNYFNSSIKFTDKIYYFQSYGGKIYGNRIALVLKMYAPYEVSGSADLTYYSKITSARATAISSDLMFGKSFKDFKWQLGSEFNSNNILNYDFRVLTKLTYNGWSII